MSDQAESERRERQARRAARMAQAQPPTPKEDPRDQVPEGYQVHWLTQGVLPYSGYFVASWKRFNWPAK
jgi:hypothetical protein